MLLVFEQFNCVQSIYSLKIYLMVHFERYPNDFRSRTIQIPAYRCVGVELRGVETILKYRNRSYDQQNKYPLNATFTNQTRCCLTFIL